MKIHISIIILVALMLLNIPTLTGHDTNLSEKYGFRSEMVEGNLLWYPQVQLTWLGNAEHPRVAWTNGTYNVVWQDDRNGNWDIYYLRLTPWGFKVVNDTRITSYSGNDTNPDLASYGSHIFVVWQRYVPSHWTIYFARLLYSNRNITIDVPPKAISTTTNNCTNPQIAIDTEGFVHVVWQEYTNNKWTIMYDKLDSSGNPVFAPIMVSSTGNSTDPALALTPANGVEIVWKSYSTTPGYSLMYRGLDCCGYHITPLRRISVVSPQTQITVSYNSNVQVVFSGKRENKSYEIIYTELNSTGITLIDDTNLTAIDGINSSAPSMVSLKNRLFVAWQEPKSVKFGEYSLTGKRLISPVVISAENASSPTLAIGNRTLGLIWLQKNNNHTVLSMRSAKIPDLMVEKIEGTQTTGNMLSINVTVKDSLPENITSTYTIKIDGAPAINGQVNISDEKILNFLLKTTPGAHKIQFTINPDEKVYETNYSNNAKEISVFLKEYSFEIIADSDCYMTDNGTNISIGILNNGNWEDNYTIKVVNISTMLSITPQNMKFSLTPGALKYGNFTVTAVQNILYGNYTVRFNVSSDSGIYKNVSIQIHVLPRVSFTLHYLEMQYVSPDSQLKLNIDVTNNGNCNDSYLINLYTTAPWPITITNNSLFLTPENTSSFSITVSIPSGLPAYTKDILMATVYSTVENRSENATILLIVEPVHKAAVYITASEYLAGAYKISLSVINQGNIADFYSFYVAGTLANYTVLSNYSALVPRNGCVNITMTINIPHTIQAGSKTVTFTVTSGNNTLTEKTVTVSVPPVYRYCATARSISIKTIEIQLLLNNTGNTVETIFIKPEINKNITWLITVSDKIYTNETYVVLKPGENITVVITTKDKLPDGEYKVSVLLTSVTAGNITLKVNAQIGAPNKGIFDIILDNILYIAIAAVAAVLVVIYFLRRE
ncbi:MAG: hypothetical protein GXO25_03605 [Euryarchaeota archaeon]|nr:hypothetical protein [Euryarchaeota archaeon]